MQPRRLANLIRKSDCIRKYHTPARQLTASGGTAVGRPECRPRPCIVAGFFVSLSSDFSKRIIMARSYPSNANNRQAADSLTDTPSTLPPQAVELEEAVLGALMLEGDSITTVQEFLTADAFYLDTHRTIYRAIEELASENKPIDLLTVTEKLKKMKKLKEVGGAPFLAQLTQKVASAMNIEFHATIIAQKYVQRELIRASTEIQKRSYDESSDVTDLIDFAESEIFKVSEGHVKRDVQNASVIFDKAMKAIEEAHAKGGTMMPFGTALPDGTPTSTFTNPLWEQTYYVLEDENASNTDNKTQEPKKEDNATNQAM